MTALKESLTFYNSELKRSKAKCNFTQVAKLVSAEFTARSLMLKLGHLQRKDRTLRIGIGDVAGFGELGAP